jgi:hypothetical protein
MVVAVLKVNAQQAMKPAEIAARIQEKYPAYCAQKIQETTQSNFNLKTAVTRFHSHDVREIVAFETARSGRWSA